MSNSLVDRILNARVYAVNGDELLHEAETMALNKDHLIIMLPRTEDPEK